MNFGFKIENTKLQKILNSVSSLFPGQWIAFPAIPSDHQICFFRRDCKDFEFLSNFYPCRLKIDGQTWPHAEAYYQAQNRPIRNIELKF